METGRKPRRSSSAPRRGAISTNGTCRGDGFDYDSTNIRLRRKAQKLGVRPLRLQDCPAHLREPGARGWKERAVGGLATRSREPRAARVSLRTRPLRRRDRPQFPRLRRHQRAPPRHQASRGSQKRKRPRRKWPRVDTIHGARDQIRTGDPRRVWPCDARPETPTNDSLIARSSLSSWQGDACLDFIKVFA